MGIMRLLAAMVLFVALGTGVQAQTTLRIGIAEDPDILDPTLARTYVGRIVFSAVCDKLFDIDEKLDIVPQLALSYETSADGKEMTIKLRPGVKFQDGEPLDAEAAKFSIERHLTFPGSFRKSELASVDHVEIVDPLTVKLVLKTPYAPLIAQLTDRAGMMVSPKAAKEAGDKFGLHPVCAGPYKFVERVAQDRIVFEKFADYWNKDNVFIDRIVYLPIVDATVRLANLKSGGLDLIERVLATDIKDVRADPRLVLSTAPELGYLGLTIKLVLKTPFSPLITQLTDRAGMMVSPKAAKEAGEKFALHPVCAGPYKFVERVQQDRIVFEKFADYWNKDNIFIDRVVFLPIVDATVRLANLKSGGLDLIERVLATDIKDVRADSRLKLSSALELGYLGLTINIGNDKNKGALSQSEKVRQALELSIDREAVNQVVFNGEFTPGNQWISPEHPYYQKAFPIPKRDVARAKALLKEAGVSSPVSVDLMVPKGAENEAVAQVLQSMAAEAGFDLKIRLIEFATAFKQAQAGEFQAFLIGWSGRIDPDGNVYVFLHTKAPQNDGVYSNPEADKGFEDARLISDPAARKAIYEKVTGIVLRDEPIIYLYHRKLLIAHTTRLEGYRPMPDGLVRVVGLKLK